MTKTRTFSSDMSSAMTLLPFREPSVFQKKGWPLGTSLKTGRWNYIDPMWAQKIGKLGSLEFLFVGDKNAGKTAAMKDITLMLMMVQAVSLLGESEDMRVFIDNRKMNEQGVGGGISGEWANIVELLKCPVFSIAEMRIEVLDPDYTDDERIQAAIGIAEIVKRKPLKIIEEFMIKVALYSMREFPKEARITRSLERALRTFKIEDYLDYVKNLDKEHEAHLREIGIGKADTLKIITHFGERPSNSDVKKMTRTALETSRYFEAILSGKFGKMFSGGNNLSTYLRRTAAMFEFGGLTADQSAMFDVLRFNTMQSAAARGDISVIPHIMVREESHESIINPVLLRTWANWSATARARHTMTLSSTQYLTNMFKGKEGSDEFKFTRQIYDGLDGMFLFQQAENKPTKKLLRDIGFNKDITKYTRTLSTGQCIVKLKNHAPYTNMFRLTPTQMNLVKSRGSSDRMVDGRVPLKQHRHYLKRRRERIDQKR